MGLFLLVLILAIIPVGSVSAHASLLSTTPPDGSQLENAPAELELQFSEPVGVVDGGTTLHQASADPVALAPVVSESTILIPLPDLEDGAYIVQWRVISADSHPISGTISFSIGNADLAEVSTVQTGAPGWVELGRTISVALKYLGLLAALGLLVTGWMIARTDLAVTMRLACAFSVIGVIGMAAELPFAAMIQIGRTATSIPELWDAIGTLDSGTRSAALFGIPLTITAAASAGIQSQPVMRTAPSALMLGGALITLLLSGHTRTREPIWLMMLSDAIHVLVAAVWLGGIIILTLGLTGNWRGEAFASADSATKAVSRFSTVAGYTAALVIVSGLAMALVIIDSLRALTDTDYGRTLLLKVGLVGLVIVLAALNRFRFIPSIAESQPMAMTWLRRLVSLELVLLASVVGVTASLVHLDPNVQAKQEAVNAQTLYNDQPALDATHTVHLIVQEQPGGELKVTAHILDDDRRVILPEADLELSWSLPAQDLGPITQTVEPDAESSGYITAVSLPASGEWQLEVRVSIDRFTDSRTTVEVVVPD